MGEGSYIWSMVIDPSRKYYQDEIKSIEDHWIYFF